MALKLANSMNLSECLLKEFCMTIKFDSSQITNWLFRFLSLLSFCINDAFKLWSPHLCDTSPYFLYKGTKLTLVSMHCLFTMKSVRTRLFCICILSAFLLGDAKSVQEDSENRAIPVAAVLGVISSVAQPIADVISSGGGDGSHSTWEMKDGSGVRIDANNCWQVSSLNFKA